jgi:hypothetical protein
MFKEIGRNATGSAASEQMELLSTHPIVEREYTLLTPMLRAAYAIARERVWTRRTGVVFYGSPRIGKSKCAEEIRRLLLDEFPTSYVVVAQARRTLRASDGHMFRLLLEAQGHILSVRTSPDLLFRNAVTHVEMETSRRKGRQFVLILDEMQLLNDTDLQQLVVLQNALVSKRIKMTTLSFAQPEILHRRTSLMTAKQGQIIARFLSEPIKFEGCSNAKELKELLKGFDEESDFPEGSGCSYTQFFVPLAFQNKFRLHHHSTAIWKALRDAADGAGDDGLPMEHVCLVIEHILLSARTEDCASFVLSKQDIVSAVEASNLENHCNAVGNGEA